uniref:Uncharacterized protein n=1 Tax=Xenopus tropicalis TaxID=8364 RepID=A0A1B8XZE5_XENTR
MRWCMGWPDMYPSWCQCLAWLLVRVWGPHDPAQHLWGYCSVWEMGTAIGQLMVHWQISPFTPSCAHCHLISTCSLRTSGQVMSGVSFLLPLRLHKLILNLIPFCANFTWDPKPSRQGTIRAYLPAILPAYPGTAPLAPACSSNMAAYCPSPLRPHTINGDIFMLYL